VEGGDADEEAKHFLTMSWPTMVRAAKLSLSSVPTQQSAPATTGPRHVRRAQEASSLCLVWDLSEPIFPVDTVS